VVRVNVTRHTVYSFSRFRAESGVPRSLVGAAMAVLLLVSAAMLVDAMTRTPASSLVHGFVTIDECLPTTGLRAWCRGTFRSDDGALTAEGVDIDTVRRAGEVEEAWVAPEFTRRALSPVNPPGNLGRGTRAYAGILGVVMAAMALWIVWRRWPATGRLGCDERARTRGRSACAAGRT
jgi:hypothetical protein